MAASRITTIGRSLQVPLALVVMAIVWQLATIVFDIPRYLLPAPSDIWVVLLDNWASLIRHSRITLFETLAGFTLSIVVGVPLAIGIVYSSVIGRILYPLLVASQAVPKIAIAPLLLVWFGFGYTPKIIVAFLIAFFPVVVNTAAGLSRVNSDLLKLASSMGMSSWKVFSKIRFPTAVPSMMSGFKIAIALSIVGAVVGEFVGANEGLGYLILVASGNFNTSLVFAAIGMLTVMGVILFYIIVAIDHRLSWWVDRDDTDNQYSM